MLRPGATVRDLGERALIDRITARLTSPAWLVLGPGDDAAVIEPERRMLQAITTDALVEGVHFDRRFCPPDAIGHKALAVNLSDLAAMGASPRAAVMSLVLPDTLPVAELDGIVDGLLAVGARHQTTIVGGNITRTTGPLVIDITAIGSVGPRRVLRRSGAMPGDDVYVTGAIGLGVAGLKALQTRQPEDAAENPAASWYLRPEPRVRMGAMLSRNRAASSCMDLSDGLADGLRQIAETSGVGLAIDAEALPVPPAVLRQLAQHCADPLLAAVSGGDDYELLFTSRPAQRGRLRAARRYAGQLPVTRIGTVTKERTVVLRSGGTTRELPPGFEHFR